MTVQCTSWMCSNNASLNIDKTQLLIIARPHNLSKLRNIELNISGKPITRVSSLRILGVVFDESMSWSVHTKKVIKSCNSAFYSILQFKNTLSPNSRKIFVNSLIMSHILYASVVWLKPYCSNYVKIDSLLRQCARFAANLCKYDSVSQFITHDIKWLFSKYLYRREVLKFVHAIRHSYSPF